jgi:signal transduction histidine kinase
VAELLANSSKHSRARQVTIEAFEVPDHLRIRVTDDGVGGAHLDAGTGLRGLTDRVSTVDGRLELDSPAGGPTVATLSLPLRP